MKGRSARPRLHQVVDYIIQNRPLCLLLLFFAYDFTSEFLIAAPSFPHWQRIGRLIGNVDKYSQMLSLDYVMDNPDFATFADRLRAMSQPPYVIFFDNSNLDVTVNHICNLKFFTGPLKRLVAVAFEEDAEKKLNSIAPFIPTVTVDFTKVKKLLPDNLENKKYITYQLILLLRARVSAALASLGIDFWAMQQDSIWTMNFGELELEAQYPDANMFFDTVGNDQFHIYNIMKGWICGSTFFVRANPTTAEFFKMVAHIMTRRQSPDSSIMTYLCGTQHYKCMKLPKSIVSSSNFFLGDRNVTPAMIQIDHDSNLKKIELFKKNNFFFRKQDGTCDPEPVKNIKRAVTEALPEVREQETEDETPLWLETWRTIKEYIGFDPYRNKIFLRVHESLV